MMKATDDFGKFKSRADARAALQAAASPRKKLATPAGKAASEPGEVPPANATHLRLAG
jgi:hypothetical protein